MVGILDFAIYSVLSELAVHLVFLSPLILECISCFSVNTSVSMLPSSEVSQAF